jgi:hypothetical protein
MCYGDPGMKHVLRETEARVAPFAQEWKSAAPQAPQAGLLARVKAAIAAWVRKEASHV